MDIISTYLRILQQKETVRNEYNNYRSLIMARERAEARAKYDLPELQADQARQDELSAKNRYILAVQNFQTQLDQFKNTLGLPIGTELALDDTALEEIGKAGLMPVRFSEEEGTGSAVKHRLDFLNEIDRFEDSQRKIKVAANDLKADLNLFANATLASKGRVDYTKFDWNNIQATAGIHLNLPLDRLRERNNYRAALINFERQIRTLGQALDDVRTSVRLDLRTLEQARQSYEIQKKSVELADRRVDSAKTYLEAGRAQVRDLLEAQNALLQARNALSQSLVDFHLAHLRFLNDIGLLDTGKDRFWLLASPSKLRPSEPRPFAPSPIGGLFHPAVSPLA